MHLSQRVRSQQAKRSHETWRGYFPRTFSCVCAIDLNYGVKRWSRFRISMLSASSHTIMLLGVWQFCASDIVELRETRVPDVP